MTGMMQDHHLLQLGVTWDIYLRELLCHREEVLSGMRIFSPESVVFHLASWVSSWLCCFGLCLCLGLFCFDFGRHLAFCFSPVLEQCENSWSKTIRFDDRQSLERARHERKKKTTTARIDQGGLSDQSILTMGWQQVAERPSLLVLAQQKRSRYMVWGGVCTADCMAWYYRHWSSLSQEDLCPSASLYSHADGGVPHVGRHFATMAPIKISSVEPRTWLPCWASRGIAYPQPAVSARGRCQRFRVAEIILASMEEVGKYQKRDRNKGYQGGGYLVRRLGRSSPAHPGDHQ